MQLSEPDKKLIADWITTKCGPMRCFCCGNSRFEILGHSGMWIGFNTHTTRVHYAEGVPVIYVACLTCGHLVPFSAGMIGLTPDPVPIAETPPTDEPM